MKNQTVVGRSGKRQEAVTVALEEEVVLPEGPHPADSAGWDYPMTLSLILFAVAVTVEEEVMLTTININSRS